jgi:outer membrane protein assembly factor BamE (lipoprotein component of BamABCDE complex)
MACFAIDDHVTVVCVHRTHHHYVFFTMNSHFTRHFAAGALSLCLFLSLCGCASVDSASGTQLSSDKISQIKKGVTTRAEVEALLGPPMNVTMMPDGRRMMMYTYTETKGHANGMDMIPVVGLFAGGGTQGQMRMQTLQVILGIHGVVEDYEFSDNTNNYATSGGGALGETHMSATNTSQSTAGK